MDKKGYCYPAVNTMKMKQDTCETYDPKADKQISGKRLYRKSRTKAMGKQFTNRYYLTPEDKRDFLFNDNDIKKVVSKKFCFSGFFENGRSNCNNRV